MARWGLSGISNAFAAFVRRYRLNRPIAEVLDSVIPVAQIDKHWQSDRLNVYGGFGQAVGDGVRLGSVGLIAQEQEVLVYKVEAWLDGAIVEQPIHMFTPLQTYDPFEFNRTIWLPWLQTSYERLEDPARLPSAFIGAGSQVALQTILVNGTPFTTVGPFYETAVVFNPPNRPPLVLWSGQDPPLRIHPNMALVVQSFDALNLATVLNVNFYFAEREPQGNVG